MQRLFFLSNFDLLIIYDQIAQDFPRNNRLIVSKAVPSRLYQKDLISIIFDSKMSRCSERLFIRVL